MSFSFRKNSDSLTSVTFLICDELDRAGFLHAFGNRHLPAATPERFVANLHPGTWELKLAQQTHSDIRLHLTDQPPLQGDALVTAHANILAGVKTADCVPLLIGDPVTRTAAAVHAGWRGTLKRIAQKTLVDLRDKYGARPEDCIIAIGPHACGDCYQIGPEVVAEFQREFSAGKNFFSKFSADGKAFFNGALANRHQLLEAGAQAHNIHNAQACTMHQNDLYFSHRKEGGAEQPAGRQLSAIGLHG